MELDGLKVNHAGLDQAADDLMGIVNKIDARMNHLEQELNPLRSNWIGDAQQAYAGRLSSLTAGPGGGHDRSRLPLSR
jgi:WXG100 family type VII secretion target